MTNQTNSPKKPVTFIVSYLLRYKWRIISGFACMVLTALFQLAMPLIMRYGIDYISGGQAAATFPAWMAPWLHGLAASGILMILAALFILTALIQGVFRYLARNILIGASRWVEYHLRNDYMRHLQSMSASFFHHHKTGDLMARATNDMEAVRSMVGPGIMYMMNTLSVGLTAILLMIRISPQMTLWSMVPMPFVAIIVYRQAGQIEKLFDRIQAQFSSLTAKVQENLSGIRVVKSYVQEGPEIRDFNRISQEYIHRNLALIRVRASLWATIEFLLGLTILTALWVGGRLVIRGGLSLGSLVAFLTYIAMLAWPMIAFGWVLNMWQEGLASAQRILTILNEEPEIRDDQRTDYRIQSIEGHIQIRGLEFKYQPAAEAVLGNITLDLPAGTTAAIVGGTGSGKSTLISLIPRLYDVPENTLFIDGHEIHSIPIEVLRRNIGLVSQEAFLFSDTLKENIGFGLNAHLAEELEKATDISQLKRDFEQFPEGYETMVGERGITLSGGQKQRTAISRAVIRKPKILILDDALSSVDTYTEEEILRHLRKVMAERTTLIVSHRISTVRDADVILVLRNGQIVEQGRHDELLARQGAYYELYQRQLLEEAIEKLG